MAASEPKKRQGTWHPDEPSCHKEPQAPPWLNVIARDVSMFARLRYNVKLCQIPSSHNSHTSRTYEISIDPVTSEATQLKHCGWWPFSVTSCWRCWSKGFMGPGEIWWTHIKMTIMPLLLGTFQIFGIFHGTKQFFLKQRRNLTTGTTPAATELKARRALEQVVDRMGYQHAMSHVAAVDVMDPLISASQRTYFATAVQLQLIRSVPDITTQIFLTRWLATAKRLRWQNDFIILHNGLRLRRRESDKIMDKLKQVLAKYKKPKPAVDSAIAATCLLKTRDLLLDCKRRGKL